MPFYENGDIRIHYKEAGSGFPLLAMPGAQCFWLLESGNISRITREVQTCSIPLPHGDAGASPHCWP